jgi:TonB family protein
LVIITVAAGNAFSQTPVLSSTPEFSDLVKRLRAGRNTQVLDELNKAVNENGLNADAWYYLGIAYLQHNNFKQASKAFDRAKELQPGLAASTHAQLAYTLVLRNQLQRALAEVTKALDLDPTNVDALYTMAVIKLRNRARDEALKHADAIIASKPDLAEGHLLRSMALVGSNEHTTSFQPETQPARLQRHQAALNALEQYLRLSSDPRAAQDWQEQLESLRFYVANDLGRGPLEIYSGRDVTTKARIIEKTEPSYSETARTEQVAGTVLITCVLAADGTTQHVLVLQSLTHGLTEASIAATKRIKFEPAILNGRPVSTLMQFEYSFNLY